MSTNAVVAIVVAAFVGYVVVQSCVKLARTDGYQACTGQLTEQTTAELDEQMGTPFFKLQHSMSREVSASMRKDACKCVIDNALADEGDLRVTLAHFGVLGRKDFKASDTDHVIGIYKTCFTSVAMAYSERLPTGVGR